MSRKKIKIIAFTVGAIVCIVLVTVIVLVALSFQRIPELKMGLLYAANDRTRILSNETYAEPGIEWAGIGRSFLLWPTDQQLVTAQSLRCAGLNGTDARFVFGYGYTIVPEELYLTFWELGEWSADTYIEKAKTYAREVAAKYTFAAGWTANTTLADTVKNDFVAGFPAAIAKIHASFVDGTLSLVVDDN